MEVIESFFDKKIDKTNTKCYNIIKIEVVSNRRLRMSMNFDEIDKEVDEIIASNEAWNKRTDKQNRKEYWKHFFKHNKDVTRVLIVFLILLVVLGVKIGVKKVQLKDSLLTGLEVQDDETFVKSLKEKKSDIKGMSQYDKYEMGLDYHDGSDSDHDGLSDKDEIEVYETDPLKSSTSGDLYTDGYKIANNMDPGKSYEMESPSFENNNCKEVTLSADDAGSMNAVVEDVTDRYSLTDYGIKKIYKGFWISNYSGTISLNLKKVFSDNDISKSDISIWLYKGDFLTYGLSDLEKCKYKMNGNQAEIEDKLTAGASYYIYVTGKKNILNSILSSTSHQTQLNSSRDTQAIFLLKESPILHSLGLTKVDVYYPDQNDDEANIKMEQRAIKLYNLQEDTDEINFIPSSADKIQKKYEKLRNMMPKLDTKDGLVYDKDGKGNLLLALFGYQCIDDGITVDASGNGKNSEDSEKVTYKKHHTSFDPYVDELPFQNFASQYGHNGNCAGMAHLTSYLFNTGSFPDNGSYDDIKWNLSTDKHNATLMDPKLDDYKTNSFVDDHSSTFNNYISEDKLTSGEKEFVKMIGAAYQEDNDKLPYLNEYMVSNGWTPDWSVAEHMMDYLDGGKILNVGLYLKNGSGHTITVYDYYYNYAGELIFRVYDSNIPQNHMDDVELNCDGACYLQCKKVLRSDGTYGMEYLYYPIQGQTEYLAATSANLMSKSAIMVYDENLNILN